MLNILSWNINRNTDAWQCVLESDYDLALLQEAALPSASISDAVEINPGEWSTGGTANRPWRTAVVKLSDDVEVEWIPTVPIDSAAAGEFGISRTGTISAARVQKEGMDPVIVLSCYAPWESYHSIDGRNDIYSDASAHRVISDLSCLVSTAKKHRIIAAGDFNILYGYGEHGSKYWKGRFQSVFERFASLGFTMAGPLHPLGRRAAPWPKELPRDSQNVPTYHTSQQGPEGATRQLDFVFASSDLSEHLSVQAWNEVTDWGPSDHCRLDIKLQF